MPPKDVPMSPSDPARECHEDQVTEEITPVETQLAPHDTFIGPPIGPNAADTAMPVRERAKRKLITTIDLTIDTCRWPFGDPAESDFHYCGKRPLIGQPYCDKHDAQSYQAARRKKTAA